MKTIINDTIVNMEMMSFEQHTHDDLLIQTSHQMALGIAPATPFRVAYITLTSNENIQPLKDRLTCLVDVNLHHGYQPRLSFKIVAKEDISEFDDNNVGGYTDDFIDNMLNDIEDGIQYNELEWERNLYPN